MVTFQFCFKFFKKLDFQGNPMAFSVLEAGHFHFSCILGE